MTVSKAQSENGSAVASAGRKSTSSPGLNFVRATSSIGALRSVAVRCAPEGTKSRNRRVTIPVPAAVSSTRAGLQAAARRAMSTVVVLRDVADKACCLTPHGGGLRCVALARYGIAGLARLDEIFRTTKAYVN